MALTDEKILRIVSSELSNSVGGGEDDSIDGNRQAALACYLGQPDGKEQEGRSTIVSTDVADAIEWILPEIVKAFTQNNQVVTFDATHSKDEDQAELESQYVYDVLMKDNNGFLIIHQFVKDALLQKNGFIKVFYEESKDVTTSAYTGLLIEEYQALMQNDSVELVELTENASEDGGPSTFDVKVSWTKDNSKISVVSVPPEEFRVSKNHNSVDLSNSRFSAHTMLKTSSDLVAEGHDKELVKTIVTAAVDSDSNYRFSMQGENTEGAEDSADESMRMVEVSECYMHIDADEDGIAEFTKITVAGGDQPAEILDIEEIDENPFISATAILMSHKLFGLSIYDRLKQIQDQKTTLLRNVFDNIFFQNNQRTIAVENQVNLEDLMLSRPGGIVRVKRPDALQPFVTPPLSGDSYKMMDYLDQVRSGRVGASPDGAISDSVVGDRVGSEGIERLMSQKEELVGLMVRVIAETGIKPLCEMIRRQVIKHQNVVKDYKFRGQWVPVNPSAWGDRPHTTIRVGTGSGNRKEQLAAVNKIIEIQTVIKSQPGQTLVTDNEIYNAIDDFAKFSGLSSAGSYVLDPRSPEGQQNKQEVGKQQKAAQEQEMREQKVMLDAQAKIANAEEMKANVSGQNVHLKSQNDQMKIQLESEKARSAANLDMLSQELEESKAALATKGKSEELEFRYWEAAQRMQVERMRIEATSQNNKGSENE